MKWYLVLVVVIFRTNIPQVVGDCNAEKGKTTCITEDLLHMLMNRPGSSPSKCECKDRNRRTAFAAILKKSVNPNTNYVFKFDKVEVNQGNNFNSDTGLFTAPTDGLYVFSCTLTVFKTGGASFYLMKNDKFYIRGYIVHTQHASHTLSVVMGLKKGDVVYVKSGNSYVVQQDYSYFSGYLL
ncbi:C1QL [Mytilus coruscus]|uniref:C1QL n=1 Tax=Mytilus coruscus TaxID=42192 RepID=A0A6J8CNC1_MYTCO|nr:C1QL [Mytilus coruscus]